MVQSIQIEDQENEEFEEKNRRIFDSLEKQSKTSSFICQ